MIGWCGGVLLHGPLPVPLAKLGAALMRIEPEHEVVVELGSDG